MIAPLAKLIDWYALQFAALLPSFRKCDKNNSKLTEAIEFLDGPNFIPAESNPATWNSNRISIFNSHRRNRASLQKTMSFTDAFIVAHSSVCRPERRGFAVVQKPTGLLSPERSIGWQCGRSVLPQMAGGAFTGKNVSTGKLESDIVGVVVL